MLVGWDCKLHKEITEATLYYCSAAASSSSADHQARRPRPSPLILPTICIGAIGGSPSFYSIGIGRYFVLDTKNLISSSRSRYSSSPSSVLSIHLPSGIRSPSNPINIEQKIRTKEKILDFTLEILYSEEKIIVSSMQLVKLKVILASMKVLSTGCKEETSFSFS